ncbi:VOC family protein [Haladaptatus salinisoli]|uniref:VOC family protein n=1 Tax=Haladaptatus salinisoli TaxID=2884876 RepID=UPI001D0AFC8C|nr:VOC family protein [Haladaptatus salinisoli]
MDPRISIVTLGVSDFEASVRFYEAGLGLPMRERADDSPIAFFELAGAWLALYPRELLAEDATVSPDGSGFEGVTLAHNVESKAEADAVLDEAVAAGAELVKPARDTDWGGYSGYFADPDGHLWEVAWNPHWEFDEADEAD